MSLLIPVNGRESEFLRCVIDERDADLVLGHRWFATRERAGWSKFYARAWIEGRTVKMHRLIVDAGVGVTVDHINGDGLDNRRCNLRFVTTAQNQTNCRIVRAASGFKGVTKQGDRYRVRIKDKGRMVHVGFFPTAQEAALAYDVESRRLWGEFSCTNADLGLI
jgi:hypothetical protein